MGALIGAVLAFLVLSTEFSFAAGEQPFDVYWYSEEVRAIIERLKGQVTQHSGIVYIDRRTSKGELCTSDGVIKVRRDFRSGGMMLVAVDDIAGSSPPKDYEKARILLKKVEAPREKSNSRASVYPEYRSVRLNDTHNRKVIDPYPEVTIQQVKPDRINLGNEPELNRSKLIEAIKANDPKVIQRDRFGSGDDKMPGLLELKLLYERSRERDIISLIDNELGITTNVTERYPDCTGYPLFMKVAVPEQLALDVAAKLMEQDLVLYAFPNMDEGGNAGEETFQSSFVKFGLPENSSLSSSATASTIMSRIETEIRSVFAKPDSGSVITPIPTRNPYDVKYEIIAKSNAACELSAWRMWEFHNLEVIISPAVDLPGRFEILFKLIDSKWTRELIGPPARNDFVHLIDEIELNNCIKRKIIPQLVSSGLNASGETHGRKSP